uniref:Uncharacterized protein n=1 Tax=Romanomermis culicivorax TaxID=13658 RepID=A0A915HS12_ROMCU
RFQNIFPSADTTFNILLIFYASSLPPSYANAAAVVGATSASASVISGSSQVIPFASPTFEYSSINVSVDLVTAAQREANFLRMIDRKAPILFKNLRTSDLASGPKFLEYRVQGKLRDVNIVPPLDVHWLWHTHMLSPLNYEKDCLNLVGFIVDHKLMSPEEIQERYQQSVSAWETFCGPNEPYDFLAVNNNSPNSPQLRMKSSDYQQKCSYDILGAAQRQQNFNYQISLPHYTSPKFLARAADRYLKFLFLKTLYPNEFLTPCYDFDLVWHSHQLLVEAVNDRCIGIDQ